MTLEEWWTAYCLRFGPRTIREKAAAGEMAFMQTVADDLGVSVVSVYLNFRHLLLKEESRASKPE